jgi:hypothetical protein
LCRYTGFWSIISIGAATACPELAEGTCPELAEGENQKALRTLKKN